MTTADQIIRLYAKASGGNRDAYAFLLLWHGWIHAIDDFVDEPGHFAPEVADLCAEGVVLCTTEFFRQHAEALGPLIAVCAEKWKASLESAGVLADVLRLGGNDLVLATAYICGGRGLMREVSKELWPIVHKTQLTPVVDPAAQ